MCEYHHLVVRFKLNCVGFPTVIRRYLRIIQIGRLNWKRLVGLLQLSVTITNSTITNYFISGDSGSQVEPTWFWIGFCLFKRRKKKIKNEYKLPLNAGANNNVRITQLSTKICNLNHIPFLMIFPAGWSLFRSGGCRTLEGSK